MASLSVSGLVPMSPAIAGKDVEMTVESMFSMKRAVATMRGIRRCLFIEIFCDERELKQGLPHIWHGEHHGTRAFTIVGLRFQAFRGKADEMGSGHVCGDFVQKP